MESLGLPLVLQLVGITVVISEVIIPSGGLLSILALGIFGYSLYLVFDSVSVDAGMIFLVVDLLLIPVVIIFGLKLLAKSPVTLRKSLSKKDGVSAQNKDLESYAGKRGQSVSDLRPAGISLIDGKRLDVVSRGEYIEKNAEVEVVSITGNQIIVRQIKDI